jgi:ubiquinol-cytochrome c reductase cytochrome c1 subunit
MKRRLLAWLPALALGTLLTPAALAVGGHGGELEKADISLDNEASLQRGAKYFVNYCQNCHSAGFMRYQRMAEDLDLTQDQVQDNLMFVPGKKFGETMTVAMPRDQAESWFGVMPPDLSVVARSRGVDWLYAYLKGFYLDDSRPFGVNNLVFDKVGMPHVLWELQGWQKPVYKTVEGPDGETHEVIEHLEVVEPGKLNEADYDRAVLDLVNFLAYMGEPVQSERKRIGVWVLLFLVVFTALAYLLKKEYWRDVH